MNKISIIIPVFNEPVEIVCEVIRRILNISSNDSVMNQGFRAEMRPTEKNLEVIVVDDGSHDFPDNLRSMFPQGNIKILKKDKNEGKGAAILSGVQIAQGDILVFLDGDGEILINKDDLFKVVSLLRVSDLVIGVRKFDKFDLHFFLTFVFSYFISKIAGKLSCSEKVFPDVLCGFRAMRRDFFEKLSPKSKSYGVELETLLKTSLIGGRIIPYRVKYRRKKAGSPTRKVKVVLSVLRENFWFVPQFITKFFSDFVPHD